MKTYIGQGKRNAKINTIIDVTIDMNKAQGYLFEGEKGTYLRFSVGQRKEVDQYGHTHTVSVWTPDTAPAAPEAAVSEPTPSAPAPKKGAKKPAKKA